MILYQNGHTIVIIDNVIFKKRKGENEMSTIKESSLHASIKLNQATGIKPIAPAAVIKSAVTKTTSTTQAITPTSAEVKETVETVVAKEHTVQQAEANVEAMDAKTLEHKAIAVAKSMQTIANEMKALFLEREEVIQDMFLALIAGHHILLLGPPGTGKSALTKEFTRRITSARMFEWLLNRTSDPSELLGPVSIKNMERDKFIRILDRKIGDCEIAFLDEIFKSNEPTLNALLPILNERVIYNDGKAVKIPLKMMVAASNEVPEEGEGLEALYDRILFKHWVDYIQDPTNRMKMMINYNDSKNPSKQNNIQRTTITFDDIQVIQKFKDYVEVPPSLVKDFNKLLLALNKKQIRFSDRKVNWCMDIIKASAIFNGRTVAIGEDIAPLANVLWERPEDVTEIALQISKVVDPYSAKIKQWNAEAMDLLDGILKLYANDPQKAMEETLEAKTKIETVINKMDKTIGDAQREGKDITAFTTSRNNISKGLQDLMCKTLGIQPATFTQPSADVNDEDDIFGDSF